MKLNFNDRFHRLIYRSRRVVRSIQKIYLRGNSWRILLYADSRGDNIPRHFDYEHYGSRLAGKYYVDAYLCPEEWTTTLDFLKLWKTIPLGTYDAVILHTGIVDASPRHQKTALEKIYPSKKDIFDEVFGKECIKKYLHTDLGCNYEGDKTINLYSLEMAHNNLLPRLKEIPNLIWISSNRIDPGWRGNYWKDRPANITIIEDYSALFITELPHVINLMQWSLDHVKYYTFDNIHPTRMGSNYIFERLIEKLAQILETNSKRAGLLLEKI